MPRPQTPSTAPTKAHAALASSTRLQLLGAIRSAAEPPTAADLVQVSGLQLSSVRFHLNELVRAALIEPIRDAPAGPGRPRMRYAAFSAGSSVDGYRMLAEILAESLADDSTHEGADEATYNGAGTDRMAGTARGRAQAAGRRWAHKRLSGNRTDNWTGGAPGGSKPSRPTLAAAASALFTEMGFESRLTETGPGAPIFEPLRQPDPVTVPMPADSVTGAARLRLHACPFAAMAREQPEVVCAAHLGVLRGFLDGLGGQDTAAALQPWDTPTTCLATISYARPAPLVPFVAATATTVTATKCDTDKRDTGTPQSERGPLPCSP